MFRYSNIEIPLQMLTNIGVDWRDKNLIAKLYLAQRTVTRIDAELSGCCVIGQGVRQGCSWSPLLFNIYIQYVINEALEDIQEGVKVGGVLIPAIRFADDQAMVSHTIRGLQVIMYALRDTPEMYNMRINTKKNKIMRMSTVQGTMKITVNGQNLERVKQFCYLGSLVTEDCRSCYEVRRRIALGKEAFNKKSDLMRGSLRLRLKTRMVKAFAWSVALYGSETWTL